ncbi:hypothetical protein [Acidisarcina polymorpha]|uniref:hypothetical protein n=1 Tax=Acidisarcina polymorpha TaxID=2211140 RepID=UPI000DEFD086|nr:hypothetical protein [Acidisarcina polymorpha]
MKTNTQNHSYNQKASSSPFLQYGIPLGRSALRALDNRGIYCQTSISKEHQHLAKRYVLRGVESGGAVSDMGRYCAYLDGDGAPIQWLQPIDSISGNGRHAVVVAPELVRIDMFRIGRTYELAITRHLLESEQGHAKPRMTSTLLFRGRDGTISFDLWAPESRSIRGTITPSFYSEAGELRDIPHSFEAAVKNVTAALNCLACKHVHVAVARSTPSNLLASA